MHLAGCSLQRIRGAWPGSRDSPFDASCHGVSGFGPDYVMASDSRIHVTTRLQTERQRTNRNRLISAAIYTVSKSIDDPIPVLG